jgi:hypothetical protein
MHTCESNASGLAYAARWCSLLNESCASSNCTNSSAGYSTHSGESPEIRGLWHALAQSDCAHLGYKPFDLTLCRTKKISMTWRSKHRCMTRGCTATRSSHNQSYVRYFKLDKTTLVRLVTDHQVDRRKVNTVLTLAAPRLRSASSHRPHKW